MAFALAPSALAADYRLEVFDTVGSTNAEALERAKSGGVGRTWFVSDHQQAGRGRRGRPWQTQRGNLAASLLLTPDDPLLPPVIGGNGRASPLSARFCDGGGAPHADSSNAKARTGSRRMAVAGKKTKAQHARRV